MSLVVHRNEQPRLFTERLSLAEYQLILRLRMMSEGVQAVRVVKSGKGREGLAEFRVVEVVRPVSADNLP